VRRRAAVAPALVRTIRDVLGHRLPWEVVRRAFWLPSAVAMVSAVGLAATLRELDAGVDLSLGLFGVNDLSSARSILTTIATVTVSVAGLSFSVTLVALQLTSSQLSPRVLSTFREDRLAQTTLAAFLGVFAYAIVLLGRLTTREGQVPELSLLAAILGVLVAFGLFVAFIGRFVAGLQASTVIRRIMVDGRRALASPHPSGIGDAPDDLEASRARAMRRLEQGPGVELRSRQAGFLVELDGERLLEAARRCDAVVVQRAQIGDLVVSGQIVGEAFVAQGREAAAARELEHCFRYAEERTMAGDVAFPVRALADVALRALSPSLNDPTTAENAMGALVETLVRFVRRGPVATLRVDREGEPRLLALAPDLDDLVVLGFSQVSAMVLDQQATLAGRLVVWLEELERAALRTGASPRETRRQLDLLRPTAEQRTDHGGDAGGRGASDGTEHASGRSSR
jgi:uncharacterized membrane protein